MRGEELSVALKYHTSFNNTNDVVASLALRGNLIATMETLIEAFLVEEQQRHLSQRVIQNPIRSIARSFSILAFAVALPLTAGWLTGAIFVEARRRLVARFFR